MISVSNQRRFDSNICHQATYRQFHYQATTAFRVTTVQPTPVSITYTYAYKLSFTVKSVPTALSLTPQCNQPQSTSMYTDICFYCTFTDTTTNPGRLSFICFQCTFTNSNTIPITDFLQTFAAWLGWLYKLQTVNTDHMATKADSFVHQIHDINAHTHTPSNLPFEE